MKKQHIVLYETNHYGWIAYLTTLAKAKRLLKIETEVYYIFKYNNIKNKSFMMKIHYPIGVYYNALQINEYNDECNKDCLILTYKQ